MGRPTQTVLCVHVYDALLYLKGDLNERTVGVVTKDQAESLSDWIISRCLWREPGKKFEMLSGIRYHVMLRTLYRLEILN